MQPNEVKWQLMAASCHRRSGNYHQALQAYKDIHSRFPENIECEYYFILHEIIEYDIFECRMLKNGDKHSCFILIGAPRLFQVQLNN
jgi:outer membrane protein assembly factor BamD (BamD/ComL family)